MCIFLKPSESQCTIYYITIVILSAINTDFFTKSCSPSQGSTQSFLLSRLDIVYVCIHCQDFRWVVTDVTIPVLIKMKGLQLSIYLSINLAICYL